MARFWPTSAPTNWLSFGGNERGEMPGLNLVEAKARPRLPDWLRRSLPATDSFARTRALLDELKLHTVCESPRSPNLGESGRKATAPFMTPAVRSPRACRFCAVTTAKPLALEAD